MDFYLPSVERTWSLNKSHTGYTITLPQIDYVSILSRYLHMPFCNEHPRIDYQYPMVTCHARAPRARVLGESNPFQKPYLSCEY